MKPRRKRNRWSKKFRIEEPLVETEESTLDGEATAEGGPPIEEMPVPGSEIGSSLGLTVVEKPEEIPENIPGASPGIDRHPELEMRPEPGEVHLRCIDYGPYGYETREFPDIDSYLKAPRPPGCTMRWLNIDGINAYVINRLRQHHGFHTLAAEDVLNTQQRPKIDSYEGYTYLVTRMLMIQQETLHNEQLSIFSCPDLLITIQEEAGDMWDPIRERLKVPDSRLRNNDTGFLLYSLLDAVVDHVYPILERYGELLDDMEIAVVEAPSAVLQRRLLAIKREMILLRRVMWPIREIVDILYRDEKRGLAAHIKPYLRDVYDHCVQIIDLIETYRELCAGLNDLYMSSVSTRLNETMKVLTILATFFIPTTFLAGVYGMNFKYFPEIQWRYGYLFFWGLCLAITAALATYFYRRGWIHFHRDE